MNELEVRQRFTNQKLSDLKEALKEAERIAEGVACVYATGSFGRGEASSHSDLDLFIVGKVSEIKGKDGKVEQKRLLSRLDEICLKAELIKTARTMGFPEFSQDGRFIVHCTVADLVKSLGTPEDDAFNTFTARMLLLLESTPIVGKSVYQEVLNDVIAGYYRDFEEHSKDFKPAFLTNDILRFWRTLCVNYEVGRADTPDNEKAKGKAKNFKLRHSRMLTCYSSLLYMLEAFSKAKTVTPDDINKMIKLKPLERVKAISSSSEISEIVAKLDQQYENFLKVTNRSESELVDLFLNKEVAKLHSGSAGIFGDSVYSLLNTLGRGSDFHRLLSV